MNVFASLFVPCRFPNEPLAMCELSSWSSDIIQQVWFIMFVLLELTIRKNRAASLTVNVFASLFVLCRFPNEPLA